MMWVRQPLAKEQLQLQMTNRTINTKISTRTHYKNLPKQEIYKDNVQNRGSTALAASISFYPVDFAKQQEWSNWTRRKRYYTLIA